MVPPAEPLPPLLLAPPELAALDELPLFFLLLEQAASVVAAAAPPMPINIERRLRPVRAPGAPALVCGSGAMSAMTPPRAVRRGWRPAGLGNFSGATFFNAFDQNHSEQSVVRQPCQALFGCSFCSGHRETVRFAHIIA